MSDPTTEIFEFEYAVDAEDRLTCVSPEWVLFACENAAAELTPEKVIGRALLDYISDEETRTIYQALLSRVRKMGNALCVKFRCDSPTLRRFMELKIETLDEGALRLTGRLLRVEARDAVALLDIQQQRSEEILVICSWCKRIRVDQVWMEVEAAVERLGLFEMPCLPRLSHGICPVCDREIREEFEIGDPA